jgi:hypothetical protein
MNAETIPRTPRTAGQNRAETQNCVAYWSTMTSLPVSLVDKRSHFTNS